LFAIGACWPDSRHAHWRALLIARAIENQAFVLGVNRTGKDPALSYAGGSIAVGPRGEVIAELGAEERVLSVEIQPSALREWRSKFPAWKDGRLLGRGAP
jgi:predicted amidohydrolase